jgi:hypothetical protein
MPINYALLVSAAILQDYLVDKDTAQALSGGIVTAYHDDARTVLKDFYEQTGSPGAYTYVPMPNPMTLSAIGTFQDANGNDVIPYWYPWLETDDTVPDFYYITVTDANGVPQFTRENFPFGAEGSGGGGGSGGQQTLINLLPNGQMLAHTNLPTVLTVANTIQNGVQAVSPATYQTTVLSDNTSAVVATGGSVGWYYIKPFGSTDTDTITFTQLSNEPGTIAGNPRYQIDLSCTATTGADTFKEFRVRFNNVNHFENGLTYTFAFNGVNNNAGTVPVTFNLIKYFGVGGSAPSETVEATFQLQANIPNIFQQQFTFTTPGTPTVGQGNDDYLELSIGLPATSTYSLSMTDFILTPGAVNFTEYPERPDNDVFAPGLVGSIPTPAADGSDLYLPLVLTQGGMIWDTSQIAKVEGYLTATPGGNLLAGDGSTYQTGGYSSLGIPYSRLQKKLITTFNGNTFPIFGNGETFVTTYLLASNTIAFEISTNEPGTITVPNAHTSGFTITTTNAASTIDYGIAAYATGSVNSEPGILIAALTPGVPTAAPTSGNSLPFTILDSWLGVPRNVAPNGYHYWSIGTTAGSTLGNGSSGGRYFAWHEAGSTAFYAWYFTGAETDPAPGGTGIKITIKGTETAQDIANITMAALAGGGQSLVIVPAVPTAGTSWSFNTTNGNSYYVWYNIAGSGADPKPGGFTLGIEVIVPASPTPTAAIVAAATQVAVANTYFAVPNLQGLSLRGFDPNNIWDTDGTNRFGVIANFFGNALGTFELDQFFDHQHPPVTVTVGGSIALDNGAGNVTSAVAAGSGTATSPPYALQSTGSNATGFAGGSETRPVNANVYWFIRY